MKLYYYSETGKKVPFNWNIELDAAIDGKITVKRADFLESLASKWVTCGVGSQCHIIPRNRDGAPLDQKLLFLGMDFYRAIETANYFVHKEIVGQIYDPIWDSFLYFKRAKETLGQIEARSIYIMNQMINTEVIS